MFLAKFCLAMRLTFGSMAMLISKTVAYGMKSIQRSFKSSIASRKKTVWCGLGAGRIMSSYFFKSEARVNIIVNDERYRTMVTDFFVPAIQKHGLHDIWFQQDVAPSRTAGITRDLVRENFAEQFISRNGLACWAPRSCDITPLDFFLWEYVKSKVFADKPTSIEALTTNMTHVIGEIGDDLLGKVIGKWT